MCRSNNGTKMMIELIDPMPTSIIHIVMIGAMECSISIRSSSCCSSRSTSVGRIGRHSTMIMIVVEM
jgi:hypothetical protein